MASPEAFRSPRRDKGSVSQFHVSSSPDLPPLQDVLSQRYRRPPLKSGSKAAPIPVDATTGFQSAGRLFRASLAQDAPALTPKATQSQLESPEDEEADASVIMLDGPVGTSSKDARHKRFSKTEASTEQLNSPETTQEMPWKKFKATPSTQDAETPPPPVEIIIPAEEEVKEQASEELKPKQKKGGTGTKSQHFGKASVTPPKSKREPAEEFVELQLEQAIARRMDWTPPTTKTYDMADAASPISRKQSSSQLEEGGGGFSALLNSFKCDVVEESKERPEVIAISDDNSSFLKKRKLIETVEIGQPGTNSSGSVPKSPSKKKAPKKKARTITEMATKAYRIPSDTEDSLPPPSALQLFVQNDDGESSALDGKGKKKAKGGKPRQSKKKVQPPKEILLSPTAAFKKFTEQDILFGTSSQLAREHSPTFLRDLQAAMKASNEIGNEPPSTPMDSDPVEPSGPKSKLWEAAARDEDGLLFDVEVVDLVNGSPTGLEGGQESNPFGYTNVGQDNNEATIRGTPINSKEMDSSTASLSNNMMETRHDEPYVLEDDDSPLSGSDISASTNIPTRKEKDLTSRPGTAASESLQRPRTAGSFDQPEEPGVQQLPRHPNFETYSDIQLSKELRQYGFKPVKRRNVMISLLEQCWQSKHGQVGSVAGTVAAFTTSSTQQSPRPKAKTATAPETLPAKKPRGRPRKDSIVETEAQEPPASAQPQESPTRARGRPRKDSASPTKTKSVAKAKADSGKSPKKPKQTRGATSTKRKKVAAIQTIEIPDSASDVDRFSTPSRSPSPEQMFSSPEPVDMSVSMADTDLSLALTPDDAEKNLFACITDAVKSAPRTTDPNHPSWHEKMLMYDPIILEDLAAWLNSGQLTKVGYDAEVKPGDVKKWCESKSVCCLWKWNLRGKERKRY